MRVLLDYRPALKDRTGVGEYAHELARALARRMPDGDELTLFTSSWRDRPDPGLAADWPHTHVVDRKLPVRPLAFAWHRLRWPPVEQLASPADIVHALHPLLIPTRRARQVVTVHDLDFLRHPERTTAEIRRDYAALVRRDVPRAAAVVVVSHHTARAVQQELGVGADRLVICRPGIPSWIGDPVDRRPPSDGYVLFVGTLEPRKNLGQLLDAWELLARSRPDSLPRLRVAGGLHPLGAGWADRMAAPPLNALVDYAGYVDGDKRRALYEGARLLVLPSLNEGFGLPVLEAMALGIPVVTSNRGALPEVAGDAGLMVDAEDPRALAEAIDAVLSDPSRAERMSRDGLTRAAAYRWETAADRLYHAYTRLLRPGMPDADRR